MLASLAASRRALLLAGSAAILLAGCKAADRPDQEGAIDTAKAAEEAFVFGYPLVANYVISNQFFINTASPQYKAPIGVLRNEGNVFTPADTAVVTPNSDTPYSVAFADLRAEPTVICTPTIEKDRYFSVQLIDMSTYNYGYIGSRTTGNDAGCFTIAGPGWKGEVPKGTRAVYRAGSDFSMLLIRTQLKSAADIDAVRAIQAQYKVQPLSAFLGAPAPAAAAAVDWPAIDEDEAKTGFLNYLAFVLQFIPATPQEADIRARLAQIGVEPGKPFDESKLSAAQKAAMLLGLKAGQDKVEAAARSNGKPHNGWMIARIDNNAAAINGNWMTRAAIAQAGIYGNDYQEALYPMTRADGTGATLDGSAARYTLTFPAGQLPPANAFWSVTMYDSKTQLLVANPIDRYLINSPMLPSMTTNPDGSLTLYIQKDSPGPDKQNNWLPAPAGPIYLVMRLYWPKDAVLDGSWQPPAVAKAG